MIVVVRGYEEKFENNTEFYELRAVLSTKDYDNVLLQIAIQYKNKTRNLFTIIYTN